MPGKWSTVLHSEELHARIGVLGWYGRDMRSGLLRCGNVHLLASLRS